jgi:Tol biopolymer transport system component
MLGAAPAEASPVGAQTPVATTTRVSVRDDGVASPGGGPTWPSISGDGRFVVFVSPAPLVEEDVGEPQDVFVHDRSAGTTRRLTPIDDTEDWWSSGAEISADGSTVLFSTRIYYAEDFDPNAPAGDYVVDRESGKFQGVTFDTCGPQAPRGYEYDADISANGRYVVFVSETSNIVCGDTNGLTDVFVRDNTNGATERVSFTPDGDQFRKMSMRASISADGSLIVFTTQPEKEELTVPLLDVYVADRDVGSVTRLPFEPAYNVAISGDGRFLAFDSSRALVPEDTNGAIDVFVYDLSQESLEKVSLSNTGGNGNLNSLNPDISYDGRFVVFESHSTTFAENTQGVPQVFLRDRSTNTTELVSGGAPGMPGNGESFGASVSDDGRFVAFASNATNLVPDDTNNTIDVFVRDRGQGVPVITAAPGTGVPVTAEPVASASVAPEDPESDQASGGGTSWWPFAIAAVVVFGAAALGGVAVLRLRGRATR